MLEWNQYPSKFYEYMIKQTLNVLLAVAIKPEDHAESFTAVQLTHSKFCVTNITPGFYPILGKLPLRILPKCQTPCSIIMALCKCLTTRPSLKPPVEKFLRSGVGNKMQHVRCDAAFVSQTARHLRIRLLGTIDES